ncbi:cytochrome-b5 reductase [Aureococcus anophagefferens]|nr:cytochrome-b5 reductase [Aureococcus anophagefferens]
MEQLLAIALVVGVVVAAALFFMGGGKKKFLDKSRQKLKLGKITKPPAPHPRPARAADHARHDEIHLRPAVAAMSLGLPPGKHVKIFAPNMTGVEAGKWNGRDDPEADVDEIQRSYTPTSSEEDTGRVDLVLKVYKGGVVDRFPDGGKMSQYFGGLKVGDEVAISGPVGMTEYLGGGKWLHGRREISASAVGMMAGGTGITPMYQILQVALKDPKDKTTFSLLFANQTPDDILIKAELDALAKKYPARFSVHYTVDRAPKGWAGSTGFISAEMIEAHLPPRRPRLASSPMIKFACKQNLDKLGYDKKLQLAF